MFGLTVLTRREPFGAFEHAAEVEGVRHAYSGRDRADAQPLVVQQLLGPLKAVPAQKFEGRQAGGAAKRGAEVRAAEAGSAGKIAECQSLVVVGGNEG